MTGLYGLHTPHHTVILHSVPMTHHGISVVVVHHVVTHNTLLLLLLRSLIPLAIVVAAPTATYTAAVHAGIVLRRTHGLLRMLQTVHGVWEGQRLIALNLTVTVMPR